MNKSSIDFFVTKMRIIINWKVINMADSMDGNCKKIGCG